MSQARTAEFTRGERGDWEIARQGDCLSRSGEDLQLERPARIRPTEQRQDPLTRPARALHVAWRFEAGLLQGAGLGHENLSSGDEPSACGPSR